MKPFLRTLAEKLYQEHGKEISSLKIVFPSRRAGVYFRHHLSEYLAELKNPVPVWSPVTLGIDDFINENCSALIADDLTLIFEIYEIYKKYNSELTFDQFYPWGQIILRDFDDIDKNDIDASRLFRILKEHKEIEEDFALSVADKEEFFRFWNSFSAKDISGLQDEFIQTWEILGNVYTELQAALDVKSICYEGMAYKNLMLDVKNGMYKPDCHKVIFAGFNQLNRCESIIFNELYKQGNAELYWNADKYYLENKSQEAGKFLNKNFVDLGINEPLWIEDNLGTTAKTIDLTGAPLEISQVKILASKLKGLSPEEISQTAIVLPDDSILLPLLNSLPQNCEAVNVTMGYSFRGSRLYTLLKLLMELQGNLRGSGKSAAFYHRDLISVLLHPLIKQFAPIEADEVVSSINKRNIIYASQKFLAESFKGTNAIIKNLFTPAGTATELYEYTARLLVSLGEYSNTGGGSAQFEIEILNRVYAELNRLHAISEKHPGELDKETFGRIFMEAAASLKIPFSGEPLKGLQVMGMLETRSLDFENVFILSVNEGILPRENSLSSFIPYALRRSFRMPLTEDEQAASAYNFYCLLQRAKNVTLLYNTETGTLTAGEKSRFIMQIEHELAARNKNITLKSSVFESDITLPKRREISVPKTDAVFGLLKGITRFSASSLTTYINCPLQFYFSRAARLREEDSVEEYFTGAAFGNLLHQIMDILYRDLKGKTADEKEIRGIMKIVNSNYDDLWKQACTEANEYAEFASIKQGKNVLFKSIIHRLVNKILEHDLLEAPFKVLAIEEKIEREMRVKTSAGEFSVTLHGRLDRVEQKEGITRIIDYKTGNVKAEKQSAKISDQEHIEKLFCEIKMKENFQQMFYATLYMNENSNSRLMVGIYPLKKITDGVYWFEEEQIPEERKKIFEEHLNKLLEEIFDPGTAFKQTEEIDRCKYCPYASICFRD
ncbi:MAG: PD-(D/E)XK nuclease family protein [Ignavibacteria bacterium]|nr:PD-(D/E)XK nuclease family protein [Ignavibacteria bacterium]